MNVVNSKTTAGLRRHRPKAFLDVQRSGSPGAPRSTSETNLSEHTMWDAGKQSFPVPEEEGEEISFITKYITETGVYSKLLCYTTITHRVWKTISYRLNYIHLFFLRYALSYCTRIVPTFPSIPRTVCIPTTISWKSKNVLRETSPHSQ